MTALQGMLAVVGVWLLLGLTGLSMPRRTRMVARVLFPLGALAGACLGALAFLSLDHPPEHLTLPIGLPGLPMHLCLDSLAAWFLFLLGVGSAGVSVFCAGYFRQGEGTAPGLMALLYHAFLAAMTLLVLANDTYTFLIMWEAMALSSYLLVLSDHRHLAVRHAGYLYLLLAHVGAALLFAAFILLQNSAGSGLFDDLRQAAPAPAVAALSMALCLGGFGAKAGLLPLHVWLPEAHPAAPSPVSALMSAVMLKMAVYGILRIAFDLLHAQAQAWGLALLGLGLATAVFGVIFSTVQTDMKRLLAYSSIENLGLIFAGLGLSAIFHGHHLDQLAALALSASLVQTLAHALFKNLLFLGTGVVLHATGERNLGKLGGLIRRMPWVAWLVLIGALAGAGLPPALSFVGEWLLLQSFLFTTVLPNAMLNMMVPLVAAAVALVVALAAYTMVKFYGVIFLGLPREDSLHKAHDANAWERAGLLWFAAGVVLCGLFPMVVLDAADPVSRQLIGTGLANQLHTSGWWLLAPIAHERASFAPLLFALGLMGGAIMALVLTRHWRRPAERHAMVWACGLPSVSARMQDSAEGFGQPIRQIFEPFFELSRHLPGAADRNPQYHVDVRDRFWNGLYLPVGRLVLRASSLIGRIQRGRISIYLLYSFLTLLVLLWVVKV
jgi:formate hydrogenlyase subunit 3/multisubunit Na+/H+ antiporter MnhD subunit